MSQRSAVVPSYEIGAITGALIFLGRRALPWLCEVAEAGELTLERQTNGADGTVALLADHDFGLAAQAFHVVLPSGHPVVLVLAGHFARSL